MNRAFSPFVKSLFVAMLAVSSVASASEAHAPAAKVDPAKGATLYAEGDNARGIAACVFPKPEIAHARSRRQDHVCETLDFPPHRGE